MNTVKSHTMDRSHLNQKHIKKRQIVYKSLFTKDVQNVHHLHGHMHGDAQGRLHKGGNGARCTMAKIGGGDFITLHVTVERFYGWE